MSDVILIKPKNVAMLKKKLEMVEGKNQPKLMHAMGNPEQYKTLLEQHKRVSAETNAALNYGMHIPHVYAPGPNVPVGNPILNAHLMGHAVQQGTLEASNSVAPFVLAAPVKPVQPQDVQLMEIDMLEGEVPFEQRKEDGRKMVEAVTDWAQTCVCCGRGRGEHKKHQFGKKGCTYTDCFYCKFSKDYHEIEAKRLNVPKRKQNRLMGKDCVFLFPEKYEAKNK
jgi:hypothetical protein